MFSVFAERIIEYSVASTKTYLPAAVVIVVGKLRVSAV